MAKVSFEVVPASGSSTSKDIEVKESGASLKDVIAASGTKVDKMLVSVNGEPVDVTKPHLIHVPAGAKVTVTEKAKGS